MSNKLGAYTWAVAAILGGCSWVDSTGRQGNESPTLDGVISGSEKSQLSLEQIKDPEGDQIITLSISPKSSALSTSSLTTACSSFFSIDKATSDLMQACHSSLATENCVLSVEKDEQTAAFVLNVPALRQSYAGRHTLQGTDQFGQAFSVSADLCLKSQPEAPVANADAFQVEFSQTSLSVKPIVYKDTQLCEPLRRSGPESVLTNDSDDVDIAESCMRAEFEAFVVAPKSPADLDLSQFDQGGFTFTPGGKYSPGDVVRFTYRAVDGVNKSTPVEVAINVTGLNQAPVAEDDSHLENPAFNAVTNPNETGGISSYQFPVLANDKDPDNLPLKIEGILNPQSGDYSADPVALAKGTLSITSDLQGVEFQPISSTDTDRHGALQFSYRLVDVGGLSDTADVSAYINDRPRVSGNGIPGQAITAGGLVGQVPVTVLDADDAASEIQVAFTVDPVASGVNASWQWADQSLKTGVISLTAPLASNGQTANVLMRLQDGADEAPGVGKYQTSFNVSVGGNQVPAIGGELVSNAVVPLSDVTLAAGENVMKNLSVSDDEAVTALTLVGSSSDTSVVAANGITFDSTTGTPVMTLTVSPGAAEGGMATISLTATDSANQVSAAESFVVRVNASPTIAPTTMVVGARPLSLATGSVSIPLVVGDEALASVVLSGSTSDESVIPNTGIGFSAIDANGNVVMTLTPSAGAIAGQTAMVTVTATDSFQRVGSTVISIEIVI